MRKNILKVAMLLTIPFAVAGLLSGDAFAQEGALIYIDENNERCYLNSPDNYGVKCENDKGKYDESTGILVLGSGLNSNSILTIHSDENMETIVKASGNISMGEIRNPSQGSGSSVVFDLGEFYLEISKFNGYSGTNVVILSGEIKAEQTGNNNTFIAKNVNMEGGSLIATATQGSSALVADKLTIINGTVKTTETAIRNIVINNGKLIIVKNNNPKCILHSSALSINGGEVDSQCAIAVAYADSSAPNNLYIDGGKVNINYEWSTDNEEALILVANNFSISAGELTLRGGMYGIVSRANAMFNGGKTSIYGPTEKSVVAPVILLGENMIIKPDDISIQTGKDEYGNDGQFIPAAELVTIYEEEHEEIPEEGSDEKEEDVKVPNTGTITGAEGSALAIFAASTAVILAIIGLATHLKNRSKDHYVFDK